MPNWYQHSDFMSTHNEGGVTIPPTRDNLIEKWVYFAAVRGFVFEFASIEQVQQCRAYFSQTLHPSTRALGHPPHEHYWHPWYCKLPKRMMRMKNRALVIKTLDTLLDKWG